jgi:lipopolysaccharide/colanic/teichoic acid biosynthesis glycosyltransferase
MRATDNHCFYPDDRLLDHVDTLAEERSEQPSFVTAVASEAEMGLIVPFLPPALSGECERRTATAERVDFRRLLDIVVSLALILFLVPVILLVLIAIKLSDRGPVMFAHRRVGRGGASFDCLKFRSMYVGAEERLSALLNADPALRREWSSSQKLLEDPRVTPLGHFLRNTSLDELPQLLNVLRGEMSLVGPRPIVTSELERYGRYAESYLAVRPGLTGLWQITRDAQTSYRRRVATDVFYVRNRSVAFDMKILVATLPAVIAGGGAG